MRVSEQLGLMWEDVDLEHNIITIRRVQERDGSTTDQTKTEAGARVIPSRPPCARCCLVAPHLPASGRQLYRVFSGLGVPQQWPLPRRSGGSPALYSNFLKRYWRPASKAAGVRHVTHHSARHSFVSTLPAQGVEVGLVAKLAGHANPAVTLEHYTQAVRGGAEALAVLERAYQIESWS